MFVPPHLTAHLVLTRGSMVRFFSFQDFYHSVKERFGTRRDNAEREKYSSQEFSYSASLCSPKTTLSDLFMMGTSPGVGSCDHAFYILFFGFVQLFSHNFSYFLSSCINRFLFLLPMKVCSHPDGRGLHRP